MMRLCTRRCITGHAPVSKTRLACMAQAAITLTATASFVVPPQVCDAFQGVSTRLFLPWHCARAQMLSYPHIPQIAGIFLPLPHQFRALLWSRPRMNGRISNPRSPRAIEYQGLRPNFGTMLHIWRRVSFTNTSSATSGAGRYC